MLLRLTRQFETEFLKTVKIKSSALCVLETWCEILDMINNYNYVIIGYKTIFWEKRKGEPLCIFLNEFLSY